MKYSVIIPCYKSCQTIEKVVGLIQHEFLSLNEPYEIILVNDCSPDHGQTWEVIFRLASEAPSIKAVNLGKNTGQHNAIMAGLRYAAGERIFAMDDDMQTHPSEMKKLIAEMEKGFDIVYGYYEKKKETLFRRFGSLLNFYTVRILIGKPRNLKTSSYWLIKRYVRDYAVQYEHPNVHLQGIFLRTTRNISCIPILHFEREVGSSTYTLRKLLDIYSSIIGFSDVPLKIVMNTGFVLAVVGLAASLAIVVRKLVHPTYIMGWPSIMAGMCFFSGILLFSVGIVGIYVGRLFQAATNTPQYVIKETVNIKVEIEGDGRLAEHFSQNMNMREEQRL